ncbi:MAG TPA: tetratricopeptide repeat protein [Dongiaceae bacterium]|nr:tetratricopeptide repeat protein [Dongiaceae bacterium]
MNRFAQRPRAIWLCALLVVVTVAAFWRVLGDDFILCDDPLYVTANVHVLGGLTWDDVVWAFTGSAAANWHPLTWLSHILDVQLFGLAPGWHHFTSLLFHTANTLLLFRFLERLTGAPWRSVMVAALFGVHPLHVESVAWVAERKDVLSTFLFLLTLMTYVRYVRGVEAARNPKSEIRNPKSEVGSLEPPLFNSQSALGPLRTPTAAYLLSLALFALGLMSKPMLVTLPFVLVLLDYWPLGRFGDSGVTTETPRHGEIIPAAHGPWTVDCGLWTNLRLLVLEKLPFFCLAFASCIVTYLVQHATHATTSVLPLASRLANAVASYLKYLAKTAWPTRLAVFYPHPDTHYPVSHQWPAWAIAAGALLLVAVSWFALSRLRRQPWLAVGWFWFLGTLAPVIGLIQVGGQAMADRYSYIPLIGIFIVTVWTAAEALDRRRAGRAVLAATGVAAIVASVAATRHQVGFWRDDFTLFQHALEVTTDNAVAEFRVGMALRQRGKAAEAIPHFKKVIEAAPVLADGYYGLAVTLEGEGRSQEAAQLFLTALSLSPWDARIHNDYGRFLWAAGRRPEAEAQYLEAVRLDPDSPEALANLGVALSGRGDVDGAIARFTAALRLKPDYAEALTRLAESFLRQGRLADAEAKYRDGVRLQPANAEMRINLGGVLWRQGRANDALAQYREAARLQPQMPVAHLNLGTALSAQGMFPGAEAEFEAAVRLKPDSLEALAGLGRALAGQGKFDQAQAPFQKAAQLCPTNADFRVFLGNALMMAGNTNAAAEAFAAALRLEPGLVQKAIQAGKALAAQGHLTAAEARFNTALWLQPGNPDAHQNLGLLFERQGRTNEASLHFQQAGRLRGQPSEGR